MSTFAHRFRAARQQAQISQRQMGRDIGLSGSAISQWETGATLPENIGAAALEQAAALIGKSVRYLLTGREGSKHKVADQNTAYLRPLNIWNDATELPPDQYVLLPKLEYHLSAGNGGPDPDAVEAAENGVAFRADFAVDEGWTPKTHFSMRAKGDNMEPTIQDGAPVVIATNEKVIQSGRIYALLIDREPLLKRLDNLPGGLVRVRSDNTSNPAYSSFEVAAGSINIIGRAVWTPVRL